MRMCKVCVRFSDLFDQLGINLSFVIIQNTPCIINKYSGVSDNASFVLFFHPSLKFTVFSFAYLRDIKGASDIFISILEMLIRGSVE